MDAYLLGIARGAPFTAAILEIADQLFLLGVNRNHGPAPAPRVRGLLVDVLELGVPVRMPRSLPGFAVCLKTVAEFAQEFADERVAHAIPLPRELRRERARALACPPQRRLRISTARRFHASFERRHETRIEVDLALAPAARSSDACGIERFGVVGFAHSAMDRGPAEPGHPREDGHAAAPQGSRFGAGPQATRSFVQDVRKHAILGGDHLFVGHIFFIGRSVPRV